MTRGHGLPEEGLPDERIIDLLLERTPAAETELQRLGTAAQTARRVEVLRDFLGKSRDVARASHPLSQKREQALVARVLDGTTREDLSWRGDLRLVASFVRERVRQSTLVRVVAASLLVHLVVGPPILAWVVLHERETQPAIYFHLEEREAPGLEDEPEEQLSPETPLALDPEIRAVREAENLVRRARYLLDPAHSALAAPEAARPDAARPLELRLLDARSRFLHAGEWADWLDAERFEREVEGPALALYVELLLDRFVLTGERAPRFHGALGRLRSAEDGQAGEALASLTLARATDYGLLDRVPTGARRDPLDAAWTSALAEALGDLAGDPIAASWLGRD